MFIWLFCDQNDVDDELHHLSKCPCLVDNQEICMDGQYNNRQCMYKVIIELLTAEDKKKYSAHETV